MEGIEKLSKYGLVKTCKVIDDSIITIIITDGFNQNAVNSLNFINECLQLFPAFPLLETCITEDDLAIIILKRKI